MNQANETSTNPSIQMFSHWCYTKHPERRYVVVGIANVAHQHADHPATVVYATDGHPERLWTRTVDEFLRDFRPEDGTDPELRNRIVNFLAHECGGNAEALADRILAVEGADDCDDLFSLEPEAVACVRRLFACGVTQATIAYSRRLVIAQITPGCSGLEGSSFKGRDGNVHRVEYLDIGNPYVETLLWLDDVPRVSAWADVVDAHLAPNT